LNVIDHRECDECRNILEELRAAFAEIQASPKLCTQLRDDASLLLRLGEQEGADEAIGSFEFHVPQPPPRYPKIAGALQKLTRHNSRTGHHFAFDQ
jgi:hypothetical protein